jgi:NAD+ synthase
LAEYLEVPDEIWRRSPTSDTYSAPCDQQEFFFRLPFALLDQLWLAQEHGVPIPEVAALMGLTEVEVSRVFADLNRKRQSTGFLRMPPIPIPPVESR